VSSGNHHAAAKLLVDKGADAKAKAWSLVRPCPCHELKMVVEGGAAQGTGKGAGAAQECGGQAGASKLVVDSEQHPGALATGDAHHRRGGRGGPGAP
jgi:hypothetical protein